MAKTLKKMLEQYKPKAADEQKFVDKHVVAKHDDVNGNKDDVFQGTKVKKIDRKKERHGYDAGEDEKVYEEVEQVDELSKPTMGSYVRAASRDVSKDYAARAVDRSNPQYFKAISARIRKREKGIDRATHKMVGEEQVEENAMEKIKSAARKALEKVGGGTDTDQLKNLQKKMGVPQTGKKPTSEEVEQVDEISDKTLSNYVTAARKDREQNKLNKSAPDTAQRAFANERDKKRIAGMNKAKSYLTPGTVGYSKNQSRRAANEEVEHLQEGEMAHAQFQKYHADTAKLLKNIHQGLSKHYDNVASKKGFNNGQAHWGHVSDIKDIHRSLQDIHDRVLQQGEYSKPVTLTKEDVDVTLLSLYANLDEENRASMLELLDEGRGGELMEFALTLKDEE